GGTIERLRRLIRIARPTRCSGAHQLSDRTEVLARLGIARLQALEQIDDLLFAIGHVGSVVRRFWVRGAGTERNCAAYDAYPKLMHEVHVQLKSPVVSRVKKGLR